jgi:hypothetical protein
MVIFSAISLLFFSRLLCSWYAGSGEEPLSEAVGSLFGGHVLLLVLVLLMDGLTGLWVAKSVFGVIVGALAYFLIFPRLASGLVLALHLIPHRSGGGS